MRWLASGAVLLSASAVVAAGTKAPPIQEVYRVALRHASLEPGQIRQWQKKIRKAPLLPRLQFRFDRTIKSNVNVDVSDSVAVNSTGVTVGPQQQRQVEDSDTDLAFEVKAVWFLDQLLFSSDDLGISQEARELAQERERILGQVRRAYFLRERLLRERQSLEAEEASAALDALTGGWFSEHLTEVP